MQGKIYGIKYDPSFKHIFSNQKHLRMFFSDVFHETICSIQYRDKESIKENKNLRYGICDLLIETKKEIIIFEMQNLDLRNLAQRMAVYPARIYASRNPGKYYRKVKPVKIFVILNYPHGSPKVLKQYRQLEIQMGEEFGRYANVSVWNIQEALKQKDTIDYKYALLFNLSDYSVKESKFILQTLKKESKFRSIVEQIELYNRDLDSYQKLKEAESMQMTFDEATAMIKFEAFHTGIQKGEKRGEKRGKFDEQVKVIKNMLGKGFPVSTIMEIADASEQLISKCQKELSKS